MSSRRARVAEACDCLLCVPVPGRAAHPVYGYELAKVAAMPCVDCEQPIGEEPYVEHLSLARFGSMSFLHQRCESPSHAKSRARMERNWDRRRA